MNDEAAIDLNFQASQDSHLIFFWLFEWPPLLQASKNLIYILNFNPYFVLYDWCSRSKTEEIASGVLVIGAMEKISNNSETPSQAEWTVWPFKKRSTKLGEGVVF